MGYVPRGGAFERPCIYHASMDGWMDGRMDGWMDGRMDGWTAGWMDGWMDGCMHACMHANIYIRLTLIVRGPGQWVWHDVLLPLVA